MEPTDYPQPSFTTVPAVLEEGWGTDGQCPVCGGQLKPYVQGRVQGMVCPGCGWNLLTTFFPPIQLDTTPYKVVLTGADVTNRDHIRGIANVVGCNFLQARRMIQQVEPILFEGRAPAIVESRRRLSQLSIQYRIDPEYPYTEEDEAKAISICR